MTDSGVDRSRSGRIVGHFFEKDTLSWVDDTIEVADLGKFGEFHRRNQTVRQRDICPVPSVSRRLGSASRAEVCAPLNRTRAGARTPWVARRPSAELDGLGAGGAAGAPGRLRGRAEDRVPGPKRRGRTMARFTSEVVGRVSPHPGHGPPWGARETPFALVTATARTTLSTDSLDFRTNWMSAHVRICPIPGHVSANEHMFDCGLSSIGSRPDSWWAGRPSRAPILRAPSMTEGAARSRPSCAPRA